MIAEAIQRAGSTDPDKMVTEMEKTDFEGTIGRIQFYGKTRRVHARHQVRPRHRHRSGLPMAERQAGRGLAGQIAEGKLKFPDFVKLSQ
jgi:branched-chain amino acid transport system substrate-binding protein